MKAKEKTFSLVSLLLFLDSLFVMLQSWLQYRSSILSFPVCKIIYLLGNIYFIVHCLWFQQLRRFALVIAWNLWSRSSYLKYILNLHQSQDWIIFFGNTVSSFSYYQYEIFLKIIQTGCLMLCSLDSLNNFFSLFHIHVIFNVSASNKFREHLMLITFRWNRNWNSAGINNIVMTTVCYCFAYCFWSMPHDSFSLGMNHMNFACGIALIFLFSSDWRRNTPKRSSSLITPSNKAENIFLSR